MKKRHFRRLALLGTAGLFGLWGTSMVYGDTTEPVESKTNSILNHKESGKSNEASDLESESSLSTVGIPAQISADYIEYNHQDGDFSASGRARVIWGEETLRSEVVLGNAQAGELIFPENLRVTMEKGTFSLAEGKYNFNQEQGVFTDGKGRVKNRYFTGETITINPNQVIVENAKFAKDISLLEDGKKPALWISSPNVEIIPGEKMIIHKPSVALGPHTLFRLPTYTTSLVPGAEEDDIPFPKIGYDSDLGVTLEYTQPLNIPAGFDGRVKLGYYHNGDFKYLASVGRNTDIGRFSLSYGSIYNDSENVWVKKKPELLYQMPHIDLGKSGFYFSQNAMVGKWKERRPNSSDHLESWRYETNSWILHKPIKLGDQTQFSFGGGVRYINEEEYDNDYSQLRGFALLEHQFTPKIYGSLSLEGNGKNKSYFKYRSTDVDNAFRPFMTYKLDNRNQFQTGVLYDLDRGAVDKYYAGWLYDLRGFQLELTYERDQENNSNDISFKVHTRMF